MSIPTLVALAQATGRGSSGSYGQVILWGGLLIGIALVGGAIWMHLRKRLFDDGEAFSIRSLLDELEASRASGAMTDEEFQKARNALLGIKPSGLEPYAEAAELHGSEQPESSGGEPPKSGSGPSGQGEAGTGVDPSDRPDFPSE